MRNALLALLFLAASLASAQESPRQPFPDDFTPSPCAPAGTCVSYDKTQLRNAAFTMLGLSPDGQWFDDHYDQLTKLYAPICRKHATCLATPGNNFLFCDDLLIRDYRAVCDRVFPKAANAHDWEQCHEFTEIWALGVDMHASAFAKEGQKCAKEQGLAVMHTKPLIVWIVPATIPRDYDGDIYVYAIDADTHVPVRADIDIENQLIRAPANPTGKTSTGYPFKWTHKFNRVKNAEGHEDLAPPTLTLRPEFHPPVTITLPATPPKMIVEMKPPKLRAGVNKVTVNVRDAETGEPVEARVMLGRDAVGESNQPIKIKLQRGTKVPEIWVTSLFNAYSDVVVK